MVPNVFISSTIKDLKYLRDIVRNTIEELGYNPIMSDYGEIGFLPSQSAEESCYTAIKDCQLVIVIIGKTYGNKGKNGYGITHNEFNTAKEEKVPIIFLVDKEVLIMQKVFQQNPNSELTLPDFDDPKLLFSLIDDFKNSEQNNGFLPFTDTTDISKLIKKQIALIFGDLLKSRGDQEKNRIKDIYTEISTIKHYLLDNKVKSEQVQYLKSYSKMFRFLLEKKNSALNFTLEHAFGSVEESFKPVLDSQDFGDLITRSKIKFKVDNKKVIVEKSNLGLQMKYGIKGMTVVDESNYIDKSILDNFETMVGIIWVGKNIITTNEKGKSYLENSYLELKKYAR
jgi:hypothetical protein